eukprot:comp12193_c0_seq1/m.6959 comp12193_c0_seq1/g.6959  ORF comp12193_c0_seq1/g.6959 comp12193_c0_seq1/m.6959 type:complete len:325 (-) comp12193_c0_seq1:208-1182(-)
MNTDEDWTANPFADPAVTQATGPSTTSIKPPASTTVEINSVGAPAQPFSPLTPTPVGASSQPRSSSLADRALADKEAELARKEEQLRRQQAELDQRERELARKSQTVKREPNWPKFPAWMPPPFKPWIFHSITDDIPVELHTTMRRMFGLWHYVCFCYLLNLIAAISGTACSTCESTGSNLGIAIAFFCLGIPGAFKMWYQILYNGIKKDRAVNFMIFFFVFGFQILANLYFALGMQGTGACGWGSMVTAWNYSGFIGFFYLLSAIGWSVCIGACVFMIVQVHAWYAGTDYTLDRVQGELATDAANNPTVRDNLADGLLRNAFT